MAAFGDKAIGLLMDEVAKMAAGFQDIATRLKALEAAPKPERGEKGDPGLSVTAEMVDERIKANGDLISLAVEGWCRENPPEAGPAGKDADPIEPDQIAAAVQAYMAANPIPVPKDGEPGKDAEVTHQMLVEAIAMGGEEINSLVCLAAENWLKANPPPAGKDGEPGKDGEKGLDGKDGENAPAPTLEQVKEALVANPRLLAESIAAHLKAFPPERGEKGEKGDPGRDALPVSTIKLETPDDGRTIIFRMGDGETEIVESITTAFPIDRGVYKPDREGGYQKGDGVTYGGGFWIARADGQLNRPGTVEGAAEWRLAVKKGRDGADGKQGKEGSPGKPGSPGRDGRAY